MLLRLLDLKSIRNILLYLVSFVICPSTPVSSDCDQGYNVSQRSGSKRLTGLAFTPDEVSVLASCMHDYNWFEPIFNLEIEHMFL